MSSETRATELAAPARSAVEPAFPALPVLLSLCDRILGELGRRQHVFAWSGTPDADGWLTVDAYYPVSRLVVMGRARAGEHDDPLGELMPARGLRLLELIQSEIPPEPSAAEEALRLLINDVGAVPVRASQAPTPEQATREASLSVNPVARILASMSLDQLPAAPEGRRVDPSQSVAAAPGAGFGMLIGLLLSAIVLIELYVGIALVGAGGGRLLLGFGLALDSGARALGTVAAGRVGVPGWIWGCVLGGSPLVAAFALLQRSGPVRVDPAPLAGLISLLASFLLLAGAVSAALRI